MEARESTARGAEVRAALLLVLVCALLFVDVLLLGNRFFIRDLTRYYYPTKSVIREVVLGGEFPYWNRHYGGGQPMAANPEYEIFYPPQWLVFLPDYDLGYRLHILIHLPIAAIGMYALLRSLGLRRRSAIFGGIVYGAGGVIVSTINLLPILFVIAWTPLVLLFARRAMLRPNVRDVALAAIVLGIQSFAGEPTSLVQTGLLVGAYALYRAWKDRRGGIRRVLMPLVLTLVIGGLGMIAGAAQLLPAADHVADSARARPFEYSLVTAWSMPFARPLELVVPRLFGHIYERGTWYWGSGLYPGTGSPFFFSIYGGLLMAALLAGSLAVRPRGGVFVLLLCAGSFLVALGGHTPLFRILYDAGIATTVRYPEKWSFVALFALIVFAAMMFDRVLDGDRKLIDAAIGFTAAVGVVALALALFGLSDFYREAFLRVWGIRRPSGPWMASLSAHDWWTVVARAAAVVALLWGARRAAGATSRLWFGAVVVVVIADLAPVALDVNPRIDRSFYTPPPVASALDGRKTSYRIFHEVDWYGSSDVAKKYFGTGEAVYWIVRNGIYPQTPATWGFSFVLGRDYDKTELLPTVDLVAAMWKVRDRGAAWWRETFMAMSNAWYYADYRDFAEERKRVDGKMKRAHPVDFVAEGAYPRYYFADEIVTIGDHDEFIDRIVAEKPSPRAAFVGFEAFESAPARVVRAVETANTARIQIEAEGRALLVMSVTPHRYWKATIDGRPAELQVVNIGYQGAVVPPGRHVVAMRYANPLVRAGMGISAAALVLLGVAAWRWRRSGSTIAAVAEADAHDVAEHPERVAHDADLRVGGVVPPHRDFGDPESEA